MGSRYSGKSSIIFLVFLFLAAAISFFIGLAAYPLFDNNEGLYAEIPREMLLSGNFIIPHLNGVPYIEKPPLLYWLIAASYSIFGVHDWAARLVPAFASVLTGLLLVFAGFRGGKRERGLFAGIIFCSSIGVAMLGRHVFFDMLLTFFLTGAVIFGGLWLNENRKYWLHLAWAALGLAVLAKGLVAILLTAATGFIFLALTKNPGRFLSFFNPLSIGIFLLIVLPWHIAATLQHPGFAYYYFISEHILRFLARREPRDYFIRPVWYYIPTVPVLLLPWSLLFIALFRKEYRNALSENGMVQLCIIWFLVTFFFFSLSAAKSTYYIVVCTPPLCMLLAVLFEKYIEKHPKAFCFAFFAFVMPFLAVVSGVFLSTFGSKYTRADIAEDANELAQRNPPPQVYLLTDYEKVSSLVYYMNRTISIGDPESYDLEYGIKYVRDSSRFPDLESLHGILESSPVWIFTRDRYLGKISELLGAGDFCRIARRGDLSLYSNRKEECVRLASTVDRRG